MKQEAAGRQRTTRRLAAARLAVQIDVPPRARRAQERKLAVTRRPAGHGNWHRQVAARASNRLEGIGTCECEVNAAVARAFGPSSIVETGFLELGPGAYISRRHCY